MTCKALIFDLDGTLLNTLADITSVTNQALASVGYPPRTVDDILSYIGNGGLHLVEQAVPAGADPSIVAHVYDSWKMLYAAYGDRTTEPFPGVLQTLTQLKARGIKLGLLSNKYENLVQMLVDKHFPGLFDVAHGERPGIARKPAPDGLLAVVDELGLQRSEVAYVGDSLPDILASTAAGIYLIGVSWGFGGQAFREDPRINTLIMSPVQLLDFVG